jgi:putative two-component system response regulator
MEKQDKLKKILVVDDSEVQLYIVENLLKSRYEITAAKSGKEALVLLSKGFVPDLILLDVLMPEMDGWETFNRIKGISLLRDVPIAFFTSLDGEQEKTYASRIGAADMIAKSCEGEELINRIQGILEKHSA